MKDLGGCVAFWTGEAYFLGGGKNLGGVQGPNIINDSNFGNTAIVVLFIYNGWVFWTCKSML